MESTARNMQPPDVASIVQEHPLREELAALCFDVLWRQSGARVAAVSRKYIRGRARFHSVQRRDAGTSLGNVLDLLLHGPAEGPEADLISGFSLYGVGRVLDLARDNGLSDEFVKRADWIAFSSPLDPYTLAHQVLSPAARERLADALVRSLEKDAYGARPLGLMRLEALATLDDDLDRVAALSRTLDDPVLAASAAALGGVRDSRISTLPPPRAVGSPPPDAEVAPELSISVFGEQVSPTGTSPWAVLAWVTGVALLARLVRAVGWSLGIRKTAGVWVEGTVVRCERITTVLGRRVHLIDESLCTRDLQAAVRELRRPTWVAVLGAGCLVGGVVGLGISVDTALGEQGLEPLALGLALLGLGAGCDLLFDYVARSRGPRVWLELIAPGRPALRIAGVDPEAAEQLLHAIGHSRNSGR